MNMLSSGDCSVRPGLGKDFLSGVAPGMEIVTCTDQVEARKTGWLRISLGHIVLLLPSRQSCSEREGASPFVSPGGEKRIPYL